MRQLRGARRRPFDRTRIISRTAAACALLAVASVGCRRSIPTTIGDKGARQVVSITEAPAGADTPGVQWVKVTAPGIGVMLAAVARPQGVGPFPALIVLHGTHGFARQYVQLAQAIARGGVVGVAACWFAGGRGAGMRFITPIGCSEAPPMSSPSSPASWQAIDALVRATRSLPGVRSDRIALFGHSRGGGATLSYLLARGSVQAAVLNSAGYPPELADRASEVKVPILMLHGRVDSPADGGSAFTNVQMARDFEAALRQADRQVEATYYEGGHNGIFSSARQRDEEVHRIDAFLERYLGD